MGNLEGTRHIESCQKLHKVDREDGEVYPWEIGLGDFEGSSQQQVLPRAGVFFGEKEPCLEMSRVHQRVSYGKWDGCDFKASALAGQTKSFPRGSMGAGGHLSPDIHKSITIFYC